MSRRTIVVSVAVSVLGIAAMIWFTSRGESHQTEDLTPRRPASAEGIDAKGSALPRSDGANDPSSGEALRSAPSGLAEQQARSRSFWIDPLRFDTDGDGLLLGEDELNAAVAYAETLSDPTHAVHPSSVDFDGDGEITVDERRRATFEYLAGVWARFGAKRFDTDGDGFISEQERTAAIEVLDAVAQQTIGRGVDLNNDGDVTDGELGFVFFADPESRLASFMQGGVLPEPAMTDEGSLTFDIDGDGEVTMSDLERINADPGLMRRLVLRRQIVNYEVLRRDTFDTDGDGRVSDAEHRRGTEAYQDRLDLDRIVAEHDGDADGRLSPAELEALRRWIALGSPRGDLNLDGATDAADLALLLRLMAAGDADG